MAVLVGCGSSSSGTQSSSKSSNTYATGLEPYGVAVGDFNGDGKLDIAVTNMASNNVTILARQGRWNLHRRGFTRYRKIPEWHCGWGF